MYSTQHESLVDTLSDAAPIYQHMREMLVARGHAVEAVTDLVICRYSADADPEGDWMHSVLLPVGFYELTLVDGRIIQQFWHFIHDKPLTEQQVCTLLDVCTLADQRYSTETPLQFLTQPAMWYFPPVVQDWLREINWPEARWNELSLHCEIQSDGIEQGSDGAYWKRWKPGEYTTITTWDETRKHLHRARFHHKDGTWTRAPLLGEGAA